MIINNATGDVATNERWVVLICCCALTT